MQKTLSLCYPTYNRGWCIKKQIERLKQCPTEILEKIEILISDNCSTDDTQQIVEDAIANGFACRYIRNKENLGMDGNFVNCFRKASGKYVWLLGDDDVIIVESLCKVVEKLSEEKDYGLLHFEMNPKAGEPEFVEYSDDDKFCKKISYWFTFISGNISQTKYVKDIPFEKYMGSFFTLIPVYFASMHGEKKNLMVNLKIFDAGLDSKRNGGYNFFQVFVNNYLGLLRDFEGKGYIKNSTRKYLKKDLFLNFLIGFIDSLLIHKVKNNLKSDKGWSILFKSYWAEIYFYSFPFILLKRNLSLLYHKIIKFI